MKRSKYSESQIIKILGVDNPEQIDPPNPEKNKLKIRA
jgi:hypothetical protein